MAVAPTASGPRGAALLLVLWILALMTGLIAVFAISARTEGLQGRFLARSTGARYAAEAGLELAALHLQGGDPNQRWVPDGRPNRIAFDGYSVEVRVLDESAKVDLNVAPNDLLVGLMVAVGTDFERARQLAGAISDFRDPDNLLSPEGGAEDPQYAAADLPYGAKDRPFETVTELRQVLGMDEALYQKLLPHVTVYTGLARPNPTFAAMPVLKALGLPADQVALIQAQRLEPQAGQPPPDPALMGSLAAQGTGTYSISSLATRKDGTRAQLRAAIRIGSGGSFGQLYLPLSWRVGESD
jgi:general secretion pathway protein K